MMRIMRVDAFINGEFTTVEKAFLNIEDRGVLFGDGVYEVARCYIDGQLFQLGEHLERLFNSAAAIRLDLPYSREELTKAIRELLAKSGMKQALVYMQATRGVGSPRTHFFPKAVKPSFFMTVRELEPEEPEIMRDGVKAVLVPDLRWARCDIKSLNLLPNVLAKEEALNQGGFEAILHKDGKVTEASSSSIFAVIDGTLYTTPPGEWILPGITSSTVVKLAGEEGIPLVYAFVPVDKILKADEVFITNSRVDIVPVTTIDSHTVSDGKPGPITTALKEAFHRFAHRGQA